MSDRHGALRRALEDAVLRGPGHSAPALRQAVAARGEMPAELRALVDKVEHHAYKITDDEIAALRARYSEDELFELIVSATLGSSMTRVRAGLAALEDA